MPISSAQASIRPSTSASSSEDGASRNRASCGRSVGRHDPCEPCTQAERQDPLLTCMSTALAHGCRRQPAQHHTIRAAMDVAGSPGWPVGPGEVLEFVGEITPCGGIQQRGRPWDLLGGTTRMSALRPCPPNSWRHTLEARVGGRYEVVGACSVDGCRRFIGAYAGYWIGYLLGWSSDAEWPFRVGGGTGRSCCRSPCRYWGYSCSAPGRAAARPGQERPGHGEGHPVQDDALTPAGGPASEGVDA